MATHSRFEIFSEEDYGNVLFGLVKAGKLQDADGLFEKLASGDFGYVRPGPTCYHSMILRCVQAQQWENALTWYDRMVADNIQPLSSSQSGLLLASFKVGGLDKARWFLHQLAESETYISNDNATLAIKLLLPEVKEEHNTQTIRKKLRQVADQKAEPARGKLLELIRSIREAEIEDDERATHNPGLATREEKGWQKVMTKLIAVHGSD